MFLWVEEKPHKQAVTGTARVGRCFGVMRGACASVCPSCDKVPDKSNLRRASPLTVWGYPPSQGKHSGSMTRGQLWLRELARCSQLDRSGGREKNSDTQLSPPFLWPQPWDGGRVVRVSLTSQPYLSRNTPKISRADYDRCRGPNSHPVSWPTPGE